MRLDSLIGKRPPCTNHNLDQQTSSDQPKPLQQIRITHPKRTFFCKWMQLRFYWSFGICGICASFTAYIQNYVFSFTLYNFKRFSYTVICRIIYVILIYCVKCIFLYCFIMRVLFIYLSLSLCGCVCVCQIV